MNTEQIKDEIARSSGWVSAVKMEMAKVVVGQQELVNRLILSLLCKGHVLLEGVPGLAKTLSVKALAGTLRAGFSRIQFTTFRMNLFFLLKTLIKNSYYL